MCVYQLLLTGVVGGRNETYLLSLHFLILGKLLNSSSNRGHISAHCYSLKVFHLRKHFTIGREFLQDFLLR